MAGNDFNVDDVLSNIRNKLHKRDTRSPKLEGDDILELTEIVNDFGEVIDDLPSANSNKDTFLADGVIKEISLHLDQLVEKVEQKSEIDKLRAEDLIREEIKSFIKVWMNKNLPEIVKAEVAREVGSLVKKYK